MLIHSFYCYPPALVRKEMIEDYKYRIQQEGYDPNSEEEQARQDQWFRTLEDFQALRKKKETFKHFCEQFLSIVVGVVTWRQQSLVKNVSQIATVSDEAFVLLCLENNWDKWVQIGIKRYGICIIHFYYFLCRHSSSTNATNMNAGNGNCCLSTVSRR